MNIDALYGSMTATVTRAKTRDWTAVQGFVIFLVFLLISTIPLLTHPLPPLEDYANHVSRMQVMADHGQNPFLAKYYEIDWEILPNLMMDLIVPSIAKVRERLSRQPDLHDRDLQPDHVRDVRAQPRALQALVDAAAGRLPTALQLHVPDRRDELLLRHRPGAVGAGRLDHAAQPPLAGYRYILSAAFAFGLYLCHLFTVGIYGLGLMAFEIWFMLSVDRAPWPTRGCASSAPASRSCSSRPFC